MIIAAILALTFQVQAPDTTFRAARIFSDGVVLQRARPMPVWGTARPGADESFRGATKAKKDGHWRVVLPPTAAGGYFEMAIESGGTVEHGVHACRRSEWRRGGCRGE